MRIAWGILLAAVVACRGEPRPVAIGLAYGVYGDDIRAVAQQVLDSLPGPYVFRIATAEVGLVPNESARSVRVASALTADPDLVGVVGPGSSRDALLTAPVYEEAGVPQLIPTGTARRLQDAGPWTFTLAPSDSAEGEFIAGFVHDHFAAQSVSVFAVADEYGSSLRATVIDALDRRQIAVADVVSIPTERGCPPAGASGVNPLEPTVTVSLRRTLTPVAVLLTRTQQSGCLARMLAARRPAMRFVAGDGTLAIPALRAYAGPAIDSLYVVSFWHAALDPERSRLFAERFRQHHRFDPNHGHALAYDAVMLLATAVRAVGPDRAAVRRYLEELGRSRPAYQGVTGPIGFHGAVARPLLVTRMIPGDSGTQVVTGP